MPMDIFKKAKRQCKKPSGYTALYGTAFLADLRLSHLHISKSVYITFWRSMVLMQFHFWLKLHCQVAKTCIPLSRGYSHGWVTAPSNQCMNSHTMMGPYFCIKPLLGDSYILKLEVWFILTNETTYELRYVLWTLWAQSLASITQFNRCTNLVGKCGTTFLSGKSGLWFHFVDFAHCWASTMQFLHQKVIIYSIIHSRRTLKFFGGKGMSLRHIT